MIRPGPANHIIDVPGINIGHAHDSTMITGVSVGLPERPAGTLDWTQDALMSLVSRNSMIGVEKIKPQKDT